MSEDKKPDATQQVPPPTQSSEQKPQTEENDKRQIRDWASI